MKRFAPILIGLVVFIIIFFGLHLFSWHMAQKAMEWADSGLSLTVIQQEWIDSGQFLGAMVV